MRILSAFGRNILLLALSVAAPAVWGADVPHKLAVGTTYIGGQIHWGFANRWALELRALKGEKTSTNTGTVTGNAYGMRGYWYFRRPSRVRFFTGLEAAATRSTSESYNYKSTGMAFGGFAGTEIYLLKRFSIGVDVGPYFLSTKVRNTDTSDGETTFVINSFMNFYFL